MSHTVPRSAPEKTPPGQVQSIARAFNVLESVAGAQAPIGLTEIAEQSGLPTGTVYRLARTLVELGYLRKDGKSKYTIGSRVLMLAHASGEAVVSISRPYLEDLATASGETVALGTLQNDSIVYLAQAAGRGTIRTFTEIGQLIHPHCTAIGKALLADWNVANVKALLARTGMPKYTERTITDADEFCAVLDVTKQLGYALNEGEQEEGMRCLSVAIPYEGMELGFSLSAPTPRMTDEVVEDYVERMLETAQALADDLYAHTSRRGAGHLLEDNH